MNRCPFHIMHYIFLLYYVPIRQVAQNWKTRLQSTSTYSSQEIDILRVKTCVGIALRCVHANRKSRPPIKMIINELEVLEAEIKKMMSMPSDDQSKDLIEQVYMIIQIAWMLVAYRLNFDMKYCVTCLTIKKIFHCNFTRSKIKLKLLVNSI